MNCLLCGRSRCEPLVEKGLRRYFVCRECGLIFVPVSDRVSIDEEKQRYALHDNTAGNEGYVAFLEEVAGAVVRYSRQNDRILDFGSGPNALLMELLRRRGYECAAYDPLYGIGTGALSGVYDTIVVCEVIEHLRELAEELGRIGRAVSETGRVVIRTKLYPSVDSFASWWYKNDCTHVNFFSPAALDVAAAVMGLRKTEFRGDDIFVFTRPARPASSL